MLARLGDGGRYSEDLSRDTRLAGMFTETRNFMLLDPRVERGEESGEGRTPMDIMTVAKPETRMMVDEWSGSSAQVVRGACEANWALMI